MKKGKINGWDNALADARQKLVDGKLYVARIKAAIRCIEQKMAAGEPWPQASQRPSA